MRIYLFFRSLANLLSFGGYTHFFHSIFRRLFARARTVVVVNDFDGDMQIQLALGEHMQRRIFWMGYCNLDIAPLLKRLLKPGMTFIDVGANIGELTLIASKAVGSSGRVVAFEPINATFERLMANLELNNFSWVEAVNKGLSDRVGEVPIYQPVANAGLSREVNNGLPSIFGDSRNGKEIQKIDLTTLDDFWDEGERGRVDVLKIDIEGAELFCLKGASRTILKQRPVIIIEVQQETASLAGYDAKEILVFLKQFDYSFYVIGSKGRLKVTDASGLGVSQNVLCLPVGFSA